MIVCNRCKREITPDTIGFNGEFKDYYTFTHLDLCDDCVPYFVFLLRDFLDTKIENDEQLANEEHRIYEGRNKKK
jgi:hypothetical protein